MNVPYVLILGHLPPPIGGVTIHVERLLSRLREAKTTFHFFELSLKNVFKIIKELIFCRVCHLHASNPHVRLIFSLFCKIIGKPLIITIHGNIGRFNRLRNFSDKCAIIFSRIPIVLNSQSLLIAQKLNSNAIKISAFIPPLEHEPLKANILKDVTSLKNRSKMLWATNAYDLSFDSNGKEIYGISDLIEVFRRNPELGLTVSDPTGNYFRHLKSCAIEIPENVLFIKEPHSFYEVMKISHGIIRNTTTDGDSLSVREALFLKKIALASNVVSRPKGAICFRGIDELESLLKRNFENRKDEQIEDLSEIKELIKIYNRFLVLRSA